MLDENRLSSIIDNWPMLVVNQYRAMNTTNPDVKTECETAINQGLANIQNDVVTNANGDVRKIMSDILTRVSKQAYNSTSYSIKDRKIYIIEGMKKEWVDYISSPAAAEIIKRIQNVLAKQNTAAPAPNTAPVANQGQAVDTGNRLNAMGQAIAQNTQAEQ